MNLRLSKNSYLTAIFSEYTVHQNCSSVEKNENQIRLSYDFYLVSNIFKAKWRDDIKKVK